MESRLTNRLRGATTLLQRVRKKFLSRASDFCLNRASEILQSAHLNRSINYMNTTTSTIRNSMDRSPLRRVFSLVTITLVSLRFLFPLGAKAADRGNANTSDGASALGALTTGYGNTGLGYDALRFTDAGNYNTGVGYQVLHQNMSGGYSTAFGTQALYSNTSGAGNTATGYKALYSNTTGGDNTATGDSALFHNTIGFNNTATGQGALGGNV
jgi:hypothetical protein